MHSSVSALAGGQEALESGRFNEAEQWFRQALAENRTSLEAARGLGLALFQLNRLGEALSILETAVRQSPSDLLVRLVLGRLCLRLQQPDEAEKHFQRILKKIPGSEPARSGLLDVAIARNRLAEAERIARQMLVLNPRSETGLFASVRLAEARGDFTDARKLCDRLLAVAPGNAENRYHRARELLRNGEFEEGWKEYEFRFRAGAVQLATPPSPRWTGERIGHLLLLAEQGLGDTLQFSRFIPQAKSLAEHVTLVCPASLTSLLARSYAIDVLPDSTPWPDHEAHLPLLSLPYLLSLGERTLSPAASYLTPEPGRRNDWIGHLASHPKTLKVGLVHATSIAHSTEQRPQTRRSCPVSDLTPLSRLPNVELWNFQISPPGDEVAPPWRPLPVPLADFDDTAAAMAALDILVTVDTAAAHVGGALGKRVALLLPYAADWRWMKDRDRTGWYPSVRLFRQSAPGDWTTPVAAVCNEIGNWDAP